MIPRWMDQAAAHAEKTFARHGITLTLGGEPTFLPVKPEGAEWNYAAVGPTKLDYAWKVAAKIRKARLPGAATFFCPGKLYPGEANPRWVVKLLANRDGSLLFRMPARGKPPGSKTLQQLGDLISKHLSLPSHWVPLSDPHNPRTDALAMPLDHDGTIWHSARWPLKKEDRFLLEAEGPVGLRLPLHLLPPTLPRRAVAIQRTGQTFSIFFPPVSQKPFLELLAAVESAVKALGLAQLELQGYLPSDEAQRWTVLGLTADPGVLEINLPACATWREYADWMETLTTCCESVGLRSYKEIPGQPQEGTGGGNHLLWGGPSLDKHPFFTRPQWLASIVRYWQHHPALAYIFTGCYVGSASQAPRPDESARDLYDINMAYTFLESLPEGDHRELINETLRHLHTDVTGNAHRSEISFDKFWNVGWPSGALGLIEFRAIESLPRADWMSAIPLLWNCLAAHLLTAKPLKNLARLGSKLHDEFFLPTRLWNDLESILDELKAAGFPIEKDMYRDIWNWRFPVLLDWKGFTVRKALEGWPLLCETPVEGGSTSRFVDTSMQRLEFCAPKEFAEQYRIYVAGRPMALHELTSEVAVSGLRYRRTNLYPSLHPGIPTQVPLNVTIVNQATGRVAAEFSLGIKDSEFQPLTGTQTKLGGAPCRGGRKGDFTSDLRLE